MNTPQRDTTVTKRVLNFLREQNDLLPRDAVIRGVFGPSAAENLGDHRRNQVSAALHHLTIHNAVGMVEQDDTRWYFARPPKDDSRVREAKSIVQGITKAPHKRGANKVADAMQRGTEIEAAAVASFNGEERPVTSTDHKVTRVTTKAYRDRVGLTKGASYGKERRIALTILPGDTLFLRPLRLQSGVYISIEEVYQYAQRREAMSMRAQALNAKKRTRKS